MRNLERNVERVCRVVTDRQADRRQATSRQETGRQLTGTTAGVYALPAVQSKLRELRRRLAPPALCPRVQIRISHSRWPVTVVPDGVALNYLIDK